MKSLLALSLLAAIGCKATESNKDQSSLDMTGFPVLSRSEKPGAKSMVSLIKNDGKFICTGVLISADEVLTAGHCDQFPDNEVTVSFGLNQLTGEKLKGKVERVHPRFTTRNDFSFDGDATIGHLNDLLIIRLDSPVPSNWAVKPATIAQNEAQIGNKYSIFGFGPIGKAIDPATNLPTEEHEDRDRGAILKTATGTMMGHPRLGSHRGYPGNKIYQNYLDAQKMFSMQIEKISIEGREDIQLHTCNGDSGSGIFNEIGELMAIHVASPDRVIAIGDASSRQPNCEAGYSYSVNLFQYKKWLQNIEEEPVAAQNIEPKAKTSSGRRGHFLIRRAPNWPSQNFNFINDGEEPIKELYVASDFSLIWGFSILNGGELKANESFHIRFDIRTCYQEFMAVTETKSYKTKLQFCETYEDLVENFQKPTELKISNMTILEN